MLLLLFEFNNFSFLIDIDNIIYTSGTCHQNSNQWQCSIIVTCLHLYHIASVCIIIGESSGHMIRTYILQSYIYTFWYNFDIVLCKFLETGTSDRCLVGIVQLLRFSGFCLYTLSLFRYSPFNKNFLNLNEIIHIP